MCSSNTSFSKLRTSIYKKMKIQCTCRYLPILQEESKSLRKRNTKVFAEILDSMPNLNHCTTWSEASQMLLDNPRFTEDPDLHSEYGLHNEF